MSRTKTTAAEPTTAEGTPTPAIAPAKKIDTVIELMTRPEGATLAELVEATGWLPHSARAALTGLRKKGHAVDRRKRDEVTCYHLEGVNVPTSIEDQLAALMALPEEKLGDEWRRVYATSPPRLSAALLRRGIAYRLQEKAYGKMPGSVSKAIMRGGRGGDEVTPGTRFVREWNGRTIDVLATAEGMMWEGRTWRSLSAIAREVTGTAWSGLRFFGVGMYG